MSRAIRLSRLHAINWYGYNDTLPVAGHLLLAGLTGSGKSVLMDLVQLVLVGSDRALFNRSATGTTSDRSLKSYVLCDTKREENGQAQYVRDKGAITYVAMEFTWPKDGRSETWGLRIEFRNAAEQQGRVTPFFCPGSLEKHHFLDAQRRHWSRRISAAWWRRSAADASLRRRSNTCGTWPTSSTSTSTARCWPACCPPPCPSPT